MGTALRTLIREQELGSKGAGIAAGAFLNDTHRVRQPIAVILDDCHVLGEGGPVPDFLTRVVEGSKSRLRFVIASRVEPPLPMARLKGRRQVLEIGPRELSFTQGETRSLLEEVHGRPASESDLSLLARSTDGWAAALQLVLATHAGKPGDLSGVLTGGIQPGSGLHDFLAQEVLDQQPPNLRRWMLLSSIFDELDPDVLGKVMTPEEVDLGVRHFTRSRLLLSFEGSGRVVYRYHALLLAFLRRRLRIEISEAERNAIHLRAADVLAGGGALLQAGTQLSMSGHWDRLSAFLVENALPLTEEGHYRSLLTLLESLPPSAIEGQPRLRVRLGDVHYHLGDLPAAESAYERARRTFRTRSRPRDEAWAVLGLGRIWNLRGQWKQAATEGEAALASVGRDTGSSDDELVIRLLQVVSGAKFYLGRYGEALRILDRLEDLCAGRPERQAAVWNNRAVIWASQGNYPEAARAFERGLERPGVRKLPRASLHLANLALLLDDMGDSERARALFQEGLDLAQSYRNQSHILSCLIGQARMHYRLGDSERSLAKLGEAEVLNRDLKLPLIMSDAGALRARILSDRGQFESARSAIRLAMESYGEGKDANGILYRIEAAVVELRAGRLREAQGSLEALEPLVRSVDAWFPRTMRLFFLGEVERRLGLPGAGPRFRKALAIARKMGYDAAVRAELRRSPESLCFLLEQGIEPEFVGRVAAKLGPEMEAILIPFVNGPDAERTGVGVALSVLTEIGGNASHQAIRSRKWRRDLAEQAWSVLKSIEDRHPHLRTSSVPERPGLRLSLLGGVEVYGPGGEKIPNKAWTSRRALHIFIYLVAKGRKGVSKERLMDLFWPGQKIQKAEKNFHPTISYIRKALKGVVSGPVITAVEGEGYRVDGELPVVTDVQVFESALSEAMALEGVQRRVALERVVSLYGGDFLEGNLDGWAEEIRAQLGLKYEQALGETGGLLLEAGEAGSALSVFRKLLERDPYREDIHGKVMMCYHSVGDRRAVREQYQHLSELLRRELQVEPLSETKRLYEILTA
jgi:LuxR family maltose regulon positive regulatory protein